MKGRKPKSSYWLLILLGVLVVLLLTVVVNIGSGAKDSVLTDLLAMSTIESANESPKATSIVPVEVTWKLPADIARLRQEECAVKSTKVTKTGGFCMGNDGVQYMKADRRLAEALVELFDGDSVVDLGAGEGWYGKIFLNHQTHPVSSYQGFDGAINVEEISNGFVNHMDLTQPSPVDRRACGNVADWVLSSVEVAEHIPPEFTDSFLRNVRCRARKGAVVSWAKPGQEGVGHVNNKSLKDFQVLMERWGFKLDEDATKTLRQRCQFQWIKHSVSVFRVE